MPPSLGPEFVVPRRLVVERERPAVEPERPAVDAERDRPAASSGFDFHKTFGNEGAAAAPIEISIPSGPSPAVGLTTDPAGVPLLVSIADDDGGGAAAAAEVVATVIRLRFSLRTFII